MQRPIADTTLRELLTPVVKEIIAEELQRAQPQLVSQHNVEAVLGIPRSLHLEYCRRPDFTSKVDRVGNLRLANVGDYRRWLRAQAERLGVGPFEEEDGAEQVLREI